MYRDQEQRDFARDFRNQPTDAEKRLWHFLRAGKLGVKFRRQSAIGAYIVDFVCFSHRLIVELDGPQHVEEKGKERDARRTAWLSARGFRVIRFRNQALDEDIWGVVEEIKGALGECELDVRQPPSPTLPAEGREPDKSWEALAAVGWEQEKSPSPTLPARGREPDSKEEGLPAEGREQEQMSEGLPAQGRDK